MQNFCIHLVIGYKKTVTKEATVLIFGLDLY